MTHFLSRRRRRSILKAGQMTSCSCSCKYGVAHARTVCSPPLMPTPCRKVSRKRCTPKCDRSPPCSLHFLTALSGSAEATPRSRTTLVLTHTSTTREGTRGRRRRRLPVADPRHATVRKSCLCFDAYQGSHLEIKFWYHLT